MILLGRGFLQFFRCPDAFTNLYKRSAPSFIMAYVCQAQPMARHQSSFFKTRIRRERTAINATNQLSWLYFTFQVCPPTATQLELVNNDNK